VTDARLTLFPIPGDEARYNLACVENGERVAFALHGVTGRLFVQQAIEIVGDHCQTVSYAYRYQSGPDRKSWLLRWEYFRERSRPDYLYPLAHVHANAEFVDPGPRRLNWTSRRRICTSPPRACRSSSCSGRSSPSGASLRRPTIGATCSANRSRASSDVAGHLDRQGGHGFSTRSWYPRRSALRQTARNNDKSPALAELSCEAAEGTRTLDLLHGKQTL
jgi:hypothetical protein